MSSDSVKLSPSEMRLFASRLKQFNTDLANQHAQLRGYIRRLGETWQDPEYAKFADEFEATLKNLRRFQQISEPVVQRLIKTADKAGQVYH